MRGRISFFFFRYIKAPGIKYNPLSVLSEKQNIYSSVLFLGENAQGRLCKIVQAGRQCHLHANEGETSDLRFSHQWILKLYSPGM
jgi:hypothetical protein